MENWLKSCRLTIGTGVPTVFSNQNDIYQDGTTPLFRDEQGVLWALSGHTHVGHIGLFRGTCVTDMQEVCEIHPLFETGAAGRAFDGRPYPEGIQSRGSIWPMGLYICPVTRRFFCFFHNETGWNGQGTGYIIGGAGDGEPDFRHIGLMYSDDEGHSWRFDRWVLTAADIGFSSLYNPDGIPARGQSGSSVSLGAGDFSVYVDQREGYLYLYYNILRVDRDSYAWQRCDAFAARTRLRTDGVMGDFVKYYDGSFCEPGNLGRESPVADRAWHPRVVFARELGFYLMTAGKVHEYQAETTVFLPDTTQVRTSRDLIHWSEPLDLIKDGQPFGNHYAALAPHDGILPASEIDNRPLLLLCHNATDVIAYPVTIQADL